MSLRRLEGPKAHISRLTRSSIDTISVSIIYNWERTRLKISISNKKQSGNKAFGKKPNALSFFYWKIKIMIYRSSKYRLSKEIRYYDAFCVTRQRFRKVRSRISTKFFI